MMLGIPSNDFLRCHLADQIRSTRLKIDLDVAKLSLLLELVQKFIELTVQCVPFHQSTPDCWMFITPPLPAKLPCQAMDRESRT